MAKFIIQITRDLELIKKTIPLVFRIPYLTATHPLYELILKVGTKRKAKEFNPIKIENGYIYTRESNDIEELKKDKKNLEKWLFGNEKELYKDERFKRALNLRPVKYVMNKIGKIIIGKGTILNCYNANAIFITWKLET